MTNTFNHDPQTYAIIGAGHEVVRHLGTGFSEAVIAEALMIEFGIRGIPFKQEVAFPVIGSCTISVPTWCASIRSSSNSK